MVEKNLKKLKAKKQRVLVGFNTGTRSMRSKTEYRRKKKWSAEDADHFYWNSCIFNALHYMLWFNVFGFVGIYYKYE